jgi:hypothetical protein
MNQRITFKPLYSEVGTDFSFRSYGTRAEGGHHRPTGRVGHDGQIFLVCSFLMQTNKDTHSAMQRFIYKLLQKQRRFPLLCCRNRPLELRYDRYENGMPKTRAPRRAQACGTLSPDTTTACALPPLLVSAPLPFSSFPHSSLSPRFPSTTSCLRSALPGHFTKALRSVPTAPWRQVGNQIAPHTRPQSFYLLSTAARPSTTILANYAALLPYYLRDHVARPSPPCPSSSILSTPTNRSTADSLTSHFYYHPALLTVLLPTYSTTLPSSQPPC